MDERIKFAIPPVTGFELSKIAEAEKLLEDYKQAIEESHRHIIVQCRNFAIYPRAESCEKYFEIKDCELITEIKWRTIKEGFESGETYFICPYCKGKNRLYDTPELLKYSEYFKNRRNVEVD